VDGPFQPREPDLDAVVRRLRGRTPPPALFPPKPWRPWDEEIERLLTGEPPAWPGGAPLRAGLLLWNDDLEGAHVLAQAIPGPTGAYWHGIMHRREGDLDNAGYWFRRVGAHPVFAGLWTAARRIAAEAERRGDRWAGERRAELERAGQWDPFRFLDWCAAARAAAERHPLLERIQVTEIELLLQHCYAGGQG
jgi:hypothetical protein